MEIDTLVDMWREFRSRDVNMNIHKDDVMHRMAQLPEHYGFVGESGLRTIVSILAVSPTPSVTSILDFGCGHGRVARYLRAFFPQAQMTFGDVDQSCVDFCASQFNGTALLTPKDFSLLSLAGKYDVIWLGSVFTHMDYARMEVLFDALFASLKINGILVGTFRGDKMYESSMRNPEVAKRDEALLEEYRKTGAAYQRYPGWKDDWGLSLVKPQKIMDLGQRNPQTRLVAYTEVGWANAHDVAAWTNTSPQTVIR